MIKTNYVFLAFIDQWLSEHPDSTGIQKRIFQEKERVIWQGESHGDLFVIIEGIAKCFITEENGRDYVLEFLGDGEIMGEIELILKSDNMSNIEALTRLETYQISQALFRQFIKENAEFNKMILKEFAIRLHTTAKKASYQQVFPIEHKVLKILLLWSQVSSALTKSDLADYLGIPIRSLNRVLKELKEKGFIENKGNEINILSKELLEQQMSGYLFNIKE